MKISVTLDDMEFGLDLNVTPGYYIPAITGREADYCCDSESQDHEFDIESVKTNMRPLTWRDWNFVDYEEKCYYNALIMKSNQLKHNDYSEEDREIILEAISEKLE